MSHQEVSGLPINTEQSLGVGEPFTQSDWDYQFDLIASGNCSRQALEEHLAKADASSSPENVAFLRKVLMDMDGAHYTPFEN